VRQPSRRAAAGTISGITAGMEYSLDGGITWIDGNGADVTGLAPGTVLVRVKATSTAPAGRIQRITIYETPSAGGGGSRSNGSGRSNTSGPDAIKSGEILTVSKSNLEQLISNGQALTMGWDNGVKLVFDTEALKGIFSQASGNIQAEVRDVSHEYQETLPGKLVFSLTVSSDDGIISDFGGKATVSFPYALKEGERVEDVTVWYLASDGTLTEIPCTYDPATEQVTFEVSHFSLYVVGIAEEKPWANPFDDVTERDWFYSAVAFAHRKGLFSGTGATTFSPRSPMTHAMFWTVLGRLDGQIFSGSDVYHAARDWAMSVGITDGSISREQLVTILWKYAGSPEADGDLSRFSDAGSVAGYAVDAMAWAVEKGIVTGANGALMPKDSATRAQTASILQKYIEAVEKCIKPTRVSRGFYNSL